MRTVVQTWLVAAATVGVTIAGAPSAASASAGCASSYRTVVLGTLGGSSSVPTGLNDRGEVVGWASTANGEVHPFRWRHGRMTDLGTLDRTGGGWAIAEDVNRHGTVVGQSRLGEVSHAVRWQYGRITDLGTLGGSYSSATAINDHGVIAGNSTTPDGVLHAFVWSDGRMTDLGVPGGGDVVAEDVNDSGQVVGFAMPTDRPAFGFLWQRGRVTVLPGPRYGGHARAINDAGLIAGTVSQAESSLAAAWRDGTYRLLGTLPGGDASGARDVNDRGVILGAGNVQPQHLDEHAFLWRRGTLSDLSLAGVPQSVVALNNRCELIGTVPNADGDGSVAALFVPGT
jgi:probable HAF family extracellular repeat protein